MKIKVLNCYTEVTLPKPIASAYSATGAHLYFNSFSLRKSKYLIVTQRYRHLNLVRLPVPPRPHFYIQQQNAVKIKVFNCYTKVSSTKSSVSASSTTGAFYKNQVVKPEVITYLIFPPRYRHLNPSRLPIPPRAHIT